MNTQDIQQIVRDLGQAKEAAQTFAEGSVGQFRQVQAAMSNLAQVSGSSLGAFNRHMQQANQEIGDNSVPALRESLDGLLGDLDRIRDFEEGLPEGQRLGEDITTLTLALRGLSSLLGKNNDILVGLGLDGKNVQTISDLTTAIMGLRTQLYASGLATGSLQSSLAGLGSGVVLVGVSYLITRVLELEGIIRNTRREMEELGTVELKKPSKLDNIKWVGGLGGYIATKFVKSMYDRFRNDNRVVFETPAEDISDEITPEKTKNRLDRIQSRVEDEELVAQAKADAKRARTNMVVSARAQAAARVEGEINREIERRRSLTETEAEIAEAEGKLLAQTEKDAADAAMQERIKALQDQKNFADRRVAQLRQEGCELAGAAKQAAQDAKDAFDALLNEQKQTPAEKRAARAEAREGRKLERRVAGARRREAELMRAGFDQEEARNLMTKRGRRLLAADDLRQNAQKAEQAVRDNKNELAEAEAQLLVDTAALGRAVAAAAPEIDKVSSVAQTLADELDNLRTQLVALSQPEASPYVGMSDEELATARDQAAEIAATDPARIARETGEAEIRKAILNGSEDTISLPADPLPSGTLPPAGPIPPSPPLAAPPAGGADILGELRIHTRLLGQIAQSEGVQ
ncbi:MAG: hypothetical protein RBU25_06295 [Lentisphaeria bacterium]|nr:hypothetical protein [Lentisphaeria bacterium]